MKLFIDTANIEEITTAFESGCIRGVTTNPSLLAKEPKGNYVEHIKKITDLARKYQDGCSVSVEVFSAESDEMIAQAQEMVEKIGYKNIAIKVPISHNGKNYLEVVRKLADKGIQVNCTACMNPMQAYTAAAAGARYVSIFYNRLRDGGLEDKFQSEREELLKNMIIEEKDFDPVNTIRETKQLISEFKNVEIITGSIRTPLDVKHAGLAGSDIITTSWKIIEKSLMHYKTNEAVNTFLSDFSQWIK